MKTLGLSDSGAIYISTNNQKCTVRFNTIKNIGGHGSNRGIFCDDGAYNLSIYGNIISKIENSYDIDSRNCTNITYRKTPDKYNFNTNNFIAYNICEKSIKVEGNSVIKENKCRFIHNIIIGNDLKNPPNKISNNSLKKEALIIDSLGIIDERSIYYPSINYIEIWSNK